MMHGQKNIKLWYLVFYTNNKLSYMPLYAI